MGDPRAGPVASPPMQALLFERKELRYAAAAVASRVVPGGGAGVGPLRLADIDPPDVPGPGWKSVRPRLTGICGSDLDWYAGPFPAPAVCPGHEIAGEPVTPAMEEMIRRLEAGEDPEKVEEELGDGYEVLIGPREAADLPKFLKEFLLKVRAPSS